MTPHDPEGVNELAQEPISLAYLAGPLLRYVAAPRQLINGIQSDCNEAGLELPLWEYSHAEGCSITGGYVYRGRGLPSLLGAYVYGDFCTGKIWGLRSDGDYVTEHMLLIDSTLSITSFGQDLVGNLYILSQNQGIYRLDVPGP